MARMWPLDGSIVTSAADGWSGWLRWSAIALRASSCSLRSIVVYTCRPPWRTVSTP